MPATSDLQTARILRLSNRRQVRPARGSSKAKPTQIDALLAASALTPAMAWKDLRNLTREP